MDTSIHTINARGNILLDVVRETAKLSPDRMRLEILELARKTTEILKRKGIQYQDFRSSLTPRVDRHEAAFIFNRLEIPAGFYGAAVMEQILPLLDPKSNNSVLCGDFIGGNQQLISGLLEESLIHANPFDFVSGNALFCIYINNISFCSMSRIHGALMQYRPYVGYIDATHSSRAKIYMSMILSNCFLKHGKKVVIGHPDDVSNEENWNSANYPFEQLGMQVCSLQEMYFGVLLTYKIERPVVKGFEADTELSLNAISDCILDISNLNVILDESKFMYLHSDKGGKLRKAGLQSMNREDLSELIRSKISSNYIYNLSFVDSHNTSKFNVMVEIPRGVGKHPSRILASLEYLPSRNELRVITIH